MAVTSITATTSSSRLCNYVLNGAAHDGSGDRRYVFASGIGCFAPIAAKAFAITRAVRSQQSIMRQAYSVVQSFSREEFDMNELASAERVHELGLELARRTFPGHQVLVVTQRDGKSGLLHNHIVVSNVSDRDAELVYRRKPRNNSFRDKLALMKGDSPDGLIEVREERPAGRAFSSAMGNRHRLAHVNDELLADMEFMQSLGLTAYDNKALMAAPSEKVTKDDRAKREQGEYVWRDDLKLIISEEQQRAVSVDDFRDRLAARRVELRERGKEKHFSYGFIDADGKARQARSLGVRGLGVSFGREATVPMVERNQGAKVKAWQQPVVAAKPVRARAPQGRTGPLLVVPEPGVVQESVIVPPVAPEPDSSWRDDVIVGLNLVLDDDDECPEPVSAPEPPDYAREPAVAPERLREPTVARTPAVKRVSVVRMPEHKRALALIEDEGKPGDKDDRSL
ncbi:relaxase/mobilization nuclease domain-containing protein [Arthrobacter sp. UYEF21]|uniref:relaxase/mobilization nuclease domain-containing protein n=1 Tax=Arthrobacter sp. UYEF21 TaxID=1756364 RepID=UPI0033981DFB